VLWPFLDHLLPEKERKARAFPIYYRVLCHNKMLHHVGGIIAIVVEYARRRPNARDLYAVVPFGWCVFKACTLALGTDI
jgi:hypothetical protein